MSTTWEPGDVVGMLERAGGVNTRPESLEGDVGLIEGAYRLSEVQAQAILEVTLEPFDRS